MPTIDSGHPFNSGLTDNNAVRSGTIPGATVVSILISPLDIRAITPPWPTDPPVPPNIDLDANNYLYVLDGSDNIIATFHNEEVVGGIKLGVVGDTAKIKTTLDPPDNIWRSYGYTADIEDGSETLTMGSSDMTMIQGAAVSITFTHLTPKPSGPFIGCPQV